MSDRAQALVVSGFLGAGKTTLVRRLLEAGQRDGIRTAVVSNEFGELGIDEALLAGAGAEYVELSGGCVCCRLSDDLLRTLQMLWERVHPQRVIVETSGLALPYDTLLNFWRDPVRQWVSDEIAVCVVSAEQVASGRDLDGTFADQVCSADLLILSKLDLVDADDVARVERVLRELAPDVPVIHASHGQVDPLLLFPPEVQEADAAERVTEETAPWSHGRHRQPLEPREHEHDRFRSFEISVAAGVTAAELERDLRARDALRIKGFVRTDQGVRVVQGVAGRIDIAPPIATPPDALIGRLVVIERAETED